jgi:transcription initiation factor TFIIA large subunit
VHAAPFSAQKWENKVIASHVAEFETPPPAPQVPSATHPAQQQHHFPSHPMHMMQNHYGATHNPYGSTVKSEPVENRYMLNPGMPYSLPPLPGPNINGLRALPISLPHPGGQTGVISFPRNASQPVSASTSARPYPPLTQTTQTTPRIPQVDGPSDSSGEEDSPSPPPGAFAPRTAHPSLPQPPVPSQSQLQPTSLDSEAINSDLDDSDTEGEDDDEEGTAGETDIVFCTYDKVRKP